MSYTDTYTYTYTHTYTCTCTCTCTYTYRDQLDAAALLRNLPRQHGGVVRGCVGAWVHGCVGAGGRAVPGVTLWACRTSGLACERQSLARAPAATPRSIARSLARGPPRRAGPRPRTDLHAVDAAEKAEEEEGHQQTQERGQAGGANRVPHGALPGGPRRCTTFALFYF